MSCTESFPLSLRLSEAKSGWRRTENYYIVHSVCNHGPGVVITFPKDYVLVKYFKIEDEDLMLMILKDKRNEKEFLIAARSVPSMEDNILLEKIESIVGDLPIILVNSSNKEREESMRVKLSNLNLFQGQEIPLITPAER